MTRGQRHTPDDPPPPSRRHVCEEPDCLARTSPSKKTFDYHTEARTVGIYKPFRYSPGGGSGGLVQDVEKAYTAGPQRHTGRGSEPVTPPVQHFARNRHHGLADGASEQVPPNTEF